MKTSVSLWFFTTSFLRKKGFVSKLAEKINGGRSSEGIIFNVNENKSNAIGI